MHVPKSVAKDFKKLQDALGLWHDYAVLTDEAIGRQLGVSDRTVRRRVAALLDGLDARTRFQAGVQTKARGWL